MKHSKGGADMKENDETANSLQDNNSQSQVDQYDGNQSTGGDSGGDFHTGSSFTEKLKPSTVLEPTRYGDWEKNGRCIDF